MRSENDLVLEWASKLPWVIVINLISVWGFKFTSLSCWDRKLTWLSCGGSKLTSF